MVISEGTSIILSNNQATAGMIQAVMEPSTVISTTALIMIFLGFIAFMTIICGIWGGLTYVRKSKEYRQKISDMYVVGVIKKLATLDQIEIEEELKKFDKDCLSEKKKAKRESQELDDTIESNLQEEVDARTEKKLTEIKNSM